MNLRLFHQDSQSRKKYDTTHPSPISQLDAAMSPPPPSTLRCRHPRLHRPRRPYCPRSPRHSRHHHRFNQEFPYDTQMAQDSVREVPFWPEPDLASRRGPRPPLGGIWAGAKPGTGAEGASSLTRAVRPNMHATRAIVIDGSTSTRTARSWLVGRRRRTVSLSC